MQDFIHEAVESIVAGDPRIAGVYLFGSRSNGDVHPDSDVDLGVLFREPVDLLDVLRLEDQLEQKLGRKVDLIDAGSCNAFLALDIIQGERFYTADADRCDEFDLYVMRRAADLEPFERERRQMLLSTESRGLRS